MAVDPALIPPDEKARLAAVRRADVEIRDDAAAVVLPMQVGLRARADGWMLAVVCEAGTVAGLLALTRSADGVRVVDDPDELS